MYMNTFIDINSYELILEDIQIEKPAEVLMNYKLNDRDLVNYMTRRRLSGNQIGGGLKKIKYSNEGNDFTLFEKRDRYGFDISIHRDDDIKNPRTCLHIQIDRNTHLAYILNISYYPNCVKTGLEHPGGGRILLKTAIQFLKDNKIEYDLKRIQLKDNSLYPCHESKKNIKLPLMHTLIFGNTWYNKYGFLPYDPDLDEPDIVLLDFLNKNAEIVRTTRVGDTNLFEHLSSALQEEQPNVSRNEIEKRIQLMKIKYSNLTIGKFFHKFLQKYDMMCSAFLRFYQQFARDQKIYDFYGRSFYLDI